MPIIGGAGQGAHGEHLALAANFDFVARKRGQVEPGARRHCPRDDELAAEFLRQFLERLAVLTASPIAVSEDAAP